MLEYVARRVAAFVPLLFLISAVSFAIIELPPGDYLSSYMLQLEIQGNRVTDEQVANLAAYYGLDKPVHTRYLLWLRNIVLRGNLGWSFAHDRPVSAVIGERIGLTLVVTISTLIFTYLTAVPIGVYSAVRQYSFFDYFWTFWGFVGLAIPNFLLALVPPVDRVPLLRRRHYRAVRARVRRRAVESGAGVEHVATALGAGPGGRDRGDGGVDPRHARHLAGRGCASSTW